ncbi:unnamed protein product, partial [Mesorhabditis belari]|uniref:Tryptophan synthase beta chain-like PALP domain-containing protein n=1 Tax=Mesorhabditis belari TaxID=2138241 RepID=A0AAF3EXB0_9BILA
MWALFSLLFSFVIILVSPQPQQPQQPLLAAGRSFLMPDDTWRREAIKTLWEERQKMIYTPLFKFNYPGLPTVDLIFKNETASRTETLKHRYAWALMMWALVEGHIGPNTTVYEASSGNTAASLAFMCQLVKVRFIAVCPDTLEDKKFAHITKYGANIQKAPNAKRWNVAQEMAASSNGFFMNQFGNADKAEEFHESGTYSLESVNVFHEFLAQLDADPNQLVKQPDYFIMPVGTGGTLSSVGKYVKKYGIATRIIFADTQYSLMGDYAFSGRFSNVSGQNFVISPGMAGIGTLPTGIAVKGKTTSLDRGVIDRVMKIPDMASTAAMGVLQRLGINGGTSSGVNFVAMLSIAANEASKDPHPRLTLSTLLADPGTFYTASYLNRTWINEEMAAHGGLLAYDCWRDVLENILQVGGDPLVIGIQRCQSAAIF